MNSSVSGLAVGGRAVRELSAGTVGQEPVALNAAQGMDAVERSEAPIFSLVVPTVSRVEEVGSLLSSIARLKYDSLEVIVVDQNSDERLVAVCSEFETLMPLKHVRVGFRGAARARNYGASLARGKILNFPDDDSEFVCGALDRVLSLFDRDIGKVLVGICTDRDGRPSTTRFELDSRPLSLWSMWNRNAECTMFFDRELFLSEGGFDEEFGVGSRYGSDEGPELLIRLLRGSKQGLVYYSHEIRFYHPDKARDFSPAGAGRAFSYAFGSGALLAKWPILPVIVRSASLLARAMLGSIVFRGDKRRYYAARFRGFVAGTTAYLTGGAAR